MPDEPRTAGSNPGSSSVTAARPAAKASFWRSRAIRGVLYQVVVLVILVLVGFYLTHNTLENMRVRGIQSGFGFFTEPAGFGIGESVIAYDSSDPYWKAFIVGFTNTLRVSIVGVVFTTIIGVLVGVGRLSRNFLIRSLCTGYVELFRNVPILLQLLMWYFIMTDRLPDTEGALNPLPGFFLSKNGLSFPVPVWATGHIGTLAGLVAGMVLAWWYARRARVKFRETGEKPAQFWPAVGFILGATLIGWLAGGMPGAFDIPEKNEISVAGGGAVTPEFLAITIGLTIYTAAFIAEIVRSAIQAVPRGQSEAAGSLGLTPGQSLRLVLLPQAMRIIIPPLTNQYLNLIKNSTLAVAVGYPDLVSISNTTLNQTGRAVECIVVMMTVYLVLSLLTAAFTNWFNARVAIRER
ncbi:MAG TPA: ABC transporter permease subunit [Burkholderiales bacterium]|nr:ABC transporter permease subunit [Burkholderiales bacterium]